MVVFALDVAQPVFLGREMGVGFPFRGTMLKRLSCPPPLTLTGVVLSFEEHARVRSAENFHSFRYSAALQLGLPRTPSLGCPGHGCRVYPFNWLSDAAVGAGGK